MLNSIKTSILVCLEGFEPPICKFVACHSIQLNYRYVTVFLLYLVLLDYSSIFKKKLKNTCKAFEFVLYYIGTLSRRSAVGSARGLGPWGRRFDSCRLDHLRDFFKVSYFFAKFERGYLSAFFYFWLSRNFWNFLIIFHSFSH